MNTNGSGNTEQGDDFVVLSICSLLVYLFVLWKQRQDTTLTAKNLELDIENWIRWTTNSNITFKSDQSLEFLRQLGSVYTWLSSICISHCFRCAPSWWSITARLSESTSVQAGGRCSSATVANTERKARGMGPYWRLRQETLRAGLENCSQGGSTAEQKWLALNGHYWSSKSDVEVADCAIPPEITLFVILFYPRAIDIATCIQA